MSISSCMCGAEDCPRCNPGALDRIECDCGHDCVQWLVEECPICGDTQCDECDMCGKCLDRVKGMVEEIKGLTRKCASTDTTSPEFEKEFGDKLRIYLLYCGELKEYTL